MKINNFRGDLTDISAKKEALVFACRSASTAACTAVFYYIIEYLLDKSIHDNIYFSLKTKSLLLCSSLLSFRIL